MVAAYISCSWMSSTLNDEVEEVEEDEKIKVSAIIHEMLPEIK